jgi:transcriptional regulator with XRE-family HTH domain
MGINCNILEKLKEHNIQNASQLKKELESKLGISISRQSLHKFIHKEPLYLKIKTIQAICNLLKVNFSEFFEVESETIIKDFPDVMKLYKKVENLEFSDSDPRKFLKWLI